MDEFVRPFAALRPEPEHAAAVAAPPYDVVNSEEARRLVDGRPNSFLRISRPETNFPRGTDPYADTVYVRAGENLQRLKALGLLTRESSPRYYVYRLEMDGHRQTGVALTASARAYEANRFRKHERTRPDKEDDRVRHMLAVKAQTGLVLSAYRADPELKALFDEVKTRPPLLEVKGQYEVTHTVWDVADVDKVTAVSAAFNRMQAIYIADGHHRSAAAARAARELRGADASGPKNSDYIVTAAFPHDEMRILGYHRVVTDLNGLDASGLLHGLAANFRVTPAHEPVTPEKSATFGLFVNERWYRLSLPAESIPAGDPVASLDVSLLQDRILGPLLGIGDPRTDPRIDFVGGIRGPEELQRRVREGEAAVAFSLFPTGMEPLMAVADAGQLMPPKSTWFEPKLADGLLTHVLD